MSAWARRRASSATENAGAGDKARRFPLFQRFGGGIAALLQAAGAGEGGVGLPGGRLRFGDLVPGLGDGGERSGERGRVLGELGIQHVAGQAGEHLTAGDLVAFLGQQFGDRQTVDLGADHDFVAGDQRAGQQDRFSQRADWRRWRY